MKKTAGIVTMYEPTTNCGNRLQNYAVQTVLERMGIDAVSYTLYDHLDDSIGAEKRIRYLIHRLTKFRFSGSSAYWKEGVPYILRFGKFNRKYIKTEIFKEIADISAKDFYVIGSDQVWNPSWYNDTHKHLYLLDFAPPEKRVCFAPSFGIEQLPEEWKPWFKERLEQYPTLSVREDAGERIIKELTGRDAQVLVDPTMMLSAEDWRKVARKPARAKKGYILTYFLSPPNAEAAKMLDRLRQEKQVYEIMDLNDPVAGMAGPSEFLWLFDHADLILTDSFHACVFSFLFNKPFVVYDRNLDYINMNSRLDTFLRKFHLERKYTGSRLDNDIWEHDYREGYGILKQEREKTMKFLAKALGENK